ncbi:MAG TPA: hypothetical protein VNZ86_03710 [Bacteroidia bacterium]|nr:hypothetical protein [Bacteroidia bacterium]
MTSIRGDTVIVSNSSAEVRNTANFSLSIQSSFSAFSIATVNSGEDSLYKYRKRSSGVKSVIGKTI